MCKLVGITYRQLDYWARTDLLRPSVSEARGSGSRRRYAYTDLVELKVIKQLLDGGVSLQATRRAIQCLRENLGADLGSANLVLAGSSSVLARSGEEVVDLVRGGQGVLNIVPLGGLVEALDAAISRLDSSPAAGRRRAAVVSEPASGVSGPEAGRPPGLALGG
ncbi:MAG: MerR family transcriptional regulator [Acidimicrobiales bacterium]